MFYVHLQKASEGKVSSMKTNMTEKDKKLLLIMFIFVIVVGIGYWGVLPQIKQYKTLQDDIDTEEIVKSINEQKVANVVFVESQCEEYEADMAENKKLFFDMMTEADIDLFLTTKAIKHNLEAYSLNISIPGMPSTRKAYIYSDLYQQQLEWEEAQKKSVSIKSDEDLLYDGKNDKEDDTKDSEKDEKKMDEVVDVFGDSSEVGVNTKVYAAKVTMTLGGDEKQLKAFLDELVSSDKKILITSFSWGEYRTEKKIENPASEGDESTISNNVRDYEIVYVKSLTISMEFYMCDQSDGNVVNGEESIED